MQTAFSNLTIKSFDDDLGIIRGIASTPATDRAGDIVEPLGASFTLPLALLHEHDRKAPLGWVTDAKPTPAGVEFEARIAKDADESISKVWRLVKAGLIPHVSVGFNPTDAEPTETGYRFKRWEWLELSLTTVPANTGARITSTKSNHGAPRMTIAAQIQQFETKRAEAHTRMTGIMTKAADEGRVLDEAERQIRRAREAEEGRLRVERREHDVGRRLLARQQTFGERRPVDGQLPATRLRRRHHHLGPGDRRTAATR